MRGSEKMKKRISIVTKKSPQSTPPQTPPNNQCSIIANSQLMHDRTDPTTLMEPTDLLPNNPSLPSCSFSGEPSTKKPNMRRSFSVLHRGVSGPSLNSEENAAPDLVDDLRAGTVTVDENSVSFLHVRVEEATRFSGTMISSTTNYCNTF
ncbi:uncharacterized protein LOC106759078 [Vigna radiata var. radiata]|uniref:Uncharacterized protein LOC106759078 n=1 Tax=Vigna radiata var. radiata TaxID=3916 RepID=A0A1S3TUZ6_VIGRR|nr:uncharacterized protein LOC106759078 [Vigna radiata var. radiata]